MGHSSPRKGHLSKDPKEGTEPARQPDGKGGFKAQGAASVKALRWTATGPIQGINAEKMSVAGVELGGGR